jgi:hypothetical protein
MNNEKFLNLLKCCMPDKPEHFVQDPKLLSCGHPICNQCITDKLGGNFIGIVCVQCKQSNVLDLKTIPILTFSKTMLEMGLTDFSKILQTKLESLRKKIEGS